LLAHLWWDWTVFWAYAFAPWALLGVLGKREKTRESVTAGVLFALIAYLLDNLGTELGLWVYPLKAGALMSSNMVWNVLGAAPEAMLIAQKDLDSPGQPWWWILGLSVANACAEIFALKTTRLMDYPRWSPLFSIPVYIVCFWAVVHFNRYVWRVEHKRRRSS
jgi:hypothetical protein